MNKKKAVWGFLSLGIAILTIMMIASGSKEFSLDTMMVYLSRANKLWLVAGLLCMFGYIWFEGYALVHISRSFFADSSYMLSFSVLCSCVCSRLISPSVSSWHKQDNTLMHQSPGHIQRRTPYNF